MIFFKGTEAAFVVRALNTFCAGLVICVYAYLEQEVHEAAMGLHLVLQLVEDDEGGERKASTLWKNSNIDVWMKYIVFMHLHKLQVI